MTRVSVSKFQYVILDTNIIQYFSNQELALEMIENLKEAVADGYRIAISDFTLYESIDGSSLKNEQERMKTLTGIPRFYVTKNVFITAAHLGCLYKGDNHEMNDIGDKIIGATSILYNAVIYTANSRDYPRPFFDEIGKRYLKYKKSGQEVVLPVYFIRPDIQLITSKYLERTKLVSYDIKNVGKSTNILPPSNNNALPSSDITSSDEPS